MQSQLMNLLEEAREQLKNASTLAEAEELRVRLLGKKSKLTEILRSMGSLSPDERKALGQAANSVRAEIEGLLAERLAVLKEAQKELKFKAERIDVTEPGSPVKLGAKHPITVTIEEITKVFMSMGF
ncbi:MAG: phenylalanine--tRNA ligase subunit alpha, partial [Firmicutes bacterium]|nr:phenylalanine--tRNA ligase subunit alpha [Bacillota bacterium]